MFFCISPESVLEYPKLVSLGDFIVLGGLVEISFESGEVFAKSARVARNLQGVGTGWEVEE